MTDVMQVLYDLPGPFRQRQLIADNLCSGRSVIWVLPQAADEAYLVDLILDICASRGVRLRKIAIRSPEEQPEVFLADQLGISLTDDRYPCIRDLAAAETTPELLVFLGLDCMPPEVSSRWIQFIMEWGESAKWLATEIGVARAVFAAIKDPGLLSIVRSDVFLEVRWYWGWLSSNDLCLIAESLSEERGLTYEEGLWMQAVAAELSGTDPALLSCFFDEYSRTFDFRDMIQVLLNFANTRGWDKESIETRLAALAGSNGPELRGHYEYRESPPSRMLPLWQDGIIDWHHEQGLFVHSSALALIGDLTTISHRIWMGQAKLLMPMLDSRRLSICHYLDKRCRWWRSFCTNHGNSESYRLNGFMDSKEPVAEFGEILAFLSQNDVSERRSLGNEVNTLRKARNTLAHYSPLSWGSFCNILNLVRGSGTSDPAGLYAVP